MNIVLIDNADEPAAHEALVRLSANFSDEEKVNVTNFKGASGFVDFIGFLCTDPLAWGERHRLIICADGVPSCFRSIGRFAKRATMSPTDYAIYYLTRISVRVTLTVVAPALGKSPLLAAIRALADQGKAQIISQRNGAKSARQKKSPREAPKNLRRSTQHRS